MAKLANEMSWSRSRMATFDWCRRQYYWQYYGKWGGWERNANAESRLAYRLSRMTDLPMLMGTTVHETIKEIIENIRQPQELDFGDPTRRAREAMAEVWGNAKKRLWEQNPKRFPPIHELYYGPPPSAEELKRCGAKVALCLQNFLNSEIYAELCSTGGDEWLAVDEGPGFDESTKLKLNGITIWALPDFARRTGDLCEIWDWKTGSRSAHDELQLLSYALFARDRLGFSPEKIRLKAFYLHDNEIAEYPCDTERLRGMEEKILADFSLLSAMVSDPVENLPLPRDTTFPQTDDLERCRRCAFRELCDR